MTKLKGLQRKAVNRDHGLFRDNRIPRWSVKIRTPGGASEVKLQVLVGNLLHECLQEVVDHLQKRHFSSRGSNDGGTNGTQIIRRTIGSIKRIHGLNKASQQNRQKLAENMRTWEAAKKTSTHQEENGRLLKHSRDANLHRSDSFEPIDDRDQF